MIADALLKQFQQVGQDLFGAQLIGTHDGNLSLRLDDKFIITRHEAMKAHLKQEDLVIIEIDLVGSGESLKIASTEALVHRKIYLETGTGAIVHAHPVDVIALSLKADKIKPLDLEGLSLLGDVPVLSKGISGDETLKAKTIADALKMNKIVVIRGHGTFSTGKDLFEAMHWTSSLASSCKMINLLSREK